MPDLKVPLADVRRVFKFLEKIHDLAHDPLNYQDTERVSVFMRDNYPEIKDLYYKIVWKWLPKEVQDQIVEE